MTASSRRRNRRPVPVSAVLGEYLASSGLEVAIERTRLLDDWPDVVGERIAGVTKAVEVRGDVLVVEVASSPWLNELTMMRGAILDRINGLPDRPPVGRIRFRLASEGPPVRRPSKEH